MTTRAEGQRPTHTILPGPTYPVALRWLAFGIFVLLAIASLSLHGPQVEVDEGSYLLSAAAIAGKLVNTGVNGYYSGYSLLIAPLFLVSADPKHIYHLVLLINAVLIATIPFALYRLTRLLHPEIDPGWHVAAAIAATCYASLLVISQYTMSESALVPLYAWLLATGGIAMFSARLAPAIGCGSIAGLLLLVHPRGAAIAGPVLAVLTLFFVRRTELRRPLAAMWIIAIAVAALHAPLEHAAGKTAAWGSSYSADSVFGRLLSPGMWPWISLNLLGTTTEAIVGSLGVFVIALRAIASDLRGELFSRARRFTPQSALTLAVLLGMGAALMMSAIFFVPPQRADQIAYGRYALPALVPMLALGLLRFSGPVTQRRYDGIWAIATGMICIAVMGFGFTYVPENVTKIWNYINAPALFLFQATIRSCGAWCAIGIYYLPLSCLVFAVSWRSGRGGITAYVLLNLLVAAAVWGVCTWQGSRLYNHDRYVTEAANGFQAVTGQPLCVTLMPKLDLWHRIDLRWRLWARTSDAQRGDSGQCVRGWIDSLEASDVVRSGMRLIATERPSPIGVAPIGLFVESGPVLENWQRVRPLPTLDSFSHLPPEQRRASIDILKPVGPVSLTVATRFDVTLRATNASTSSTWASVQDGPYPILVGAKAVRDGDNEISSGSRARFTRTTGPGDSSEMKITIGPFKQPGVYRVTIGVLQELVAWYPGAQTIIVAVAP